MVNERIKELAQKFLKGEATPEEVHELHSWYEDWQDDEELVSLEQNETEEELRLKMLAAIRAKIPSLPKPVKIRPWKNWYRVAAAAAIVIGIATVFYLKNPTANSTVPSTTASASPATGIPAPGTTKATITLADGTQLALDASPKGVLASQGRVKLLKTGDGQISYQGNGGALEQYNTLYNPRGSRPVSLILSDGTKVWLNAESSLHYPVAFTGKERRVAITGEAYFEVTHHQDLPFRVQKGDMQVTVLGTHFNVKAYEEEPDIQVTLLEGSVKVNKANKACLIKPGQQARVAADLKIIKEVNLDEVMSWMNGKFQFGEASDIKTIMKEIARWYDLEVYYQGTVTDHIGGTIPRDANAIQVFQKLELTGVVTFQINGKKVTVMPK